MPRDVHMSAEEIKIVLRGLEILECEIMIGDNPELPKTEEVQKLHDKISGKKNE